MTSNTAARGEPDRGPSADRPGAPAMSMTSAEVWAMTEEELQDVILARCEDRDVWPVMARPERRSQRVAANKGFPDLHIVGPGGDLYRELKSMKGNGPGRGLNPSQVTWKYRLLCGGYDWAIWTPADLAGGRVDVELDAIATPDEYTDEFALAFTRN